MSRRARPELVDFGTARAQLLKLRWIAVIAGVVVLLILSAHSIAGFYMEGLWFEKLGFGARFWSEVQMRTLVSMAGGLVGGLLLWATFAALSSAFPRSLERFAFDDEERGLLEKIAATEIAVVGRILSAGKWAGLMLGGVFFGFLADGEWDEVARWWYSVPSGKVDPIYGRDLSFYLLKYPLADNAVDIASLLAIIALVVLLLVTLWFWNPATRRIRAQQPAMVVFGSRVMRLWGIWLAVLFLLLSCRHWLSRIKLLWTEHSSFIGIDYIGDHWWRNAGMVLIAAAVLTALSSLVFAFSPRQQRVRRLAFSIGALYGLVVVVCYLVGGLYWWLSVRPNELVAEAPYIKHNIVATRQAFGIDQFHETQYVPSEENRQAVYNERAAFSNVRVWDWLALQATLQQQQSLRTFYSFPDIDLDRYSADGRTMSVMVAAREININQLAASGQAWTNRHFIYTHGYGLTMNSVNQFSPEGGPALILKDMPVVSSTASLKITRPEIYFGETTEDHVYVTSSQPEFDYPVGEGNQNTVYSGKAGIPIHGLVRKIAAAIYLGDGFQLLLSNYVTENTRVLFHRQILARAREVAPFLVFDHDPYIVLTNEGRIKFVLDAYTHSATFPLAAWQRLYDEDINYARNSVKVVIDAYDGTVTMYVMDESDPILAAYRRFWPELFTDRAKMPRDLVEHLRYPEDLMRMQAEAYSVYHMEDPRVFYNREDVWQIARQVRAQEDGNKEVEVSPYFIQTSFVPGGVPEFVLILPLTPSKRNNLIGWMAAGCDGANYGRMRVYRFPKNRLTVGPLQMEARIDQHSELSPMLTLWNQQGSRVLRGDMLALPIAKQMVYVEPIYLQAQRSPMPELRLVVIGLENDLVFGRTFDEAFSKLGSGAPSAQPPPSPSAPGAPPPPAPELDAASLVRSAQEHLRNYQRATAEGRYRDAGAELDALKSDLDRLAALRHR